MSVPTGGRPLFELILAEAERGRSRPPSSSALTELLFFYVIRDIAGSDEVAGGLAVARRVGIRAGGGRGLREPGDWSVDAMAASPTCPGRASAGTLPTPAGQPPSSCCSCA